jgi:hypothetical protein
MRLSLASAFACLLCATTALAGPPEQGASFPAMGSFRGINVAPNGNGAVFTVQPLPQFGNVPASNSSSLSSIWTDITSGGSNLGSIVFNSHIDSTVIGNSNRSADHDVWNSFEAASFNGTLGSSGLRGSVVANYAQTVRRGPAPITSTTVATTLGSPGTTLQISDTTQFQTSPFDGAAISVSHPANIFINGHIYSEVGVSTASGAGTITLSSNVTVADGTLGNTVTIGNDPEMWSQISEYRDQTGASSKLTGAAVTHEFDHLTNNLDEQAERYVLQATIQANYGLNGNGALGYPPEVTYGLYLGNVSNEGSFRSTVWLAGAFSQAALDLRQSSMPSYAVTSLTPGSPVSQVTVSSIMPYTSAGAAFLQTSPTNPLKVTMNGHTYQVVGYAFSAPSGGNVTAAGTLTFASPVPAADAANGTVVYRQDMHALWFSDNEDIALDSSGHHSISYSTSDSKLYYKVNGVAMFSVDDSGNVKAAGTITGSTTP